MPPNIKLYKDEECSQPLSEIDFGEVELGETVTVKAYIRNEGNRALHDIKLNFGKHLTVNLAKPDLKPKEVVSIEFVWATSPNTESDLNEEVEVKGKFYVFKEG